MSGGASSAGGSAQVLQAPSERGPSECGLARLPRLAATLVAWGLLWLAGPGALGPDPHPWLGVLGMAVWGAAAARPGRHAFLIDWLGGGLGLAATMWWIQYVLPAGVPVTAVVTGLYVAVAGMLLRRLVKSGVALGLALPLAWVALETLRDSVHPPFGMGWLRVGHLGVEFAPFASAMATVGVVGVSFALCGAAGALAELARVWRPTLGLGSMKGAAAGAALAVGVAALGLATPLGELETGPRVLIVQPGLTQTEKQMALSTQSRFDRHLQLTAEGLRDGGPAPDLILWPETALPFALDSPGLDAAIEEGATLDPWHRESWRRLTPEQLKGIARDERASLLEGLLPQLPEGTAFLSGAEQWVVLDGELRRRNIAALWAGGERTAIGAKLNLAPGGETLYGLGDFGPLREYVLRTARYLPDFLPGKSVGLGSIGGPDPDGYTVTLTVCFDNAFVDPYLEGARAGADFHAVLSNEAWYRRSIELDQMVVFSRALAAATRRPVVRCTNSGVSAVLGADGQIQERLVRNGDDRELAGWLAADLAVPADRESATFFSRSGGALRRGATLTGPIVLLLAASRRRRSAPESTAEAA